MNKLVDSVKDRATAQLDSQKGRATDGLHVVANAVRQTTQQLRTDQHDTIAQYVDKAADQLDRLSNTLRDKSVNDLMLDAQRLAKRQPALFIGGSFAVGLLAARFLKSSREQGTPDIDYHTGGTAQYAGGTSGHATGGTAYATGSSGYSASHNPLSERGSL
jgi:hypothetical protein